MQKLEKTYRLYNRKTNHWQLLPVPNTFEPAPKKIQKFQKYPLLTI